MDFNLLNKVMTSKLSCAQRMILIVLLNHAGDKGVAWPSQATIASQAGLHEDTIGGNITVLEELGWLKKERRGGYHYTLGQGRNPSGSKPVRAGLGPVAKSGRTPGSSCPKPGGKGIQNPALDRVASGSTPGESGSTPGAIRSSTGQTNKEPPNNHKTEPPTNSPSGELGLQAEKSENEKSGKKPKPKKPPQADPRHKPFTEAFTAAWGERQGHPYKPNGADAIQLHSRLKHTDLTVDQLMTMVRRCWAAEDSGRNIPWAMRQAATIRQFCTQFENIIAAFRNF